MKTNNKTLSNKIERLTKLVDEIIKEGRPVITLRDAVLMLLYAQRNVPIYSRIMLFKEVFLLYEEILKKYDSEYLLQNPKFEGYKYGPYSFELADVIDQLYWSGYIEIRGKRNTRLETFLITEKGVREIQEKFESLPEELKEEIRKMRKGWDQLSVDGILRYVYQKYPSYKKKSKIRDRYKEIMWGGKG